tara:strand:- start:655 stop:1257 length:603 start_codon:yes stop_codon:yes gene_type:complete
MIKEFNKINKNKVSFGSINQKLFTFEELQVLLNLRPFLSTKRFIPCNNTEKHTWLNYYWVTDDNCWPINIIKEHIKNYSCYLKDSSRANKKINDVANILEKKFKKSVDCHIYFSLYKNVEHFKKHKDTRPNVIIVSEGTIKVEIFSKIKQKKILNTGDFVYIPAEVYHKLTPLTQKRISCSFAIDGPLEGICEEREWITI